jgi:DDE superfamily endonuclease
VLPVPVLTIASMGLYKRILQFLLWRAICNKRKKKTFRDRLTLEGRRRRQRNLPRASLLPPQESAWQKLYDAKDDPALITITGFDYRAFNAMHDLFKPLFEQYSPWTPKNPGYYYKRVDINQVKGSARIISSSQCLALVLAWYRFRGSEYVLQGWFGFTGCHTNVWLRFGRRMLLKCLINHPLARVEMPSNEGIERLKQLCQIRHASLGDVYCTADGLKIAFQSCSELRKQSMYYNGWVGGHYVTNLFVYSIEGRIIEACINVPGSVHDSSIAHMFGVYKKLEEKHLLTGGKCVVDSAFAAANRPCLIRSSQDLTKACDAAERVRLEEATSLRQTSEWGMRAIQGAFPRLKDAMKYEEKGERIRILRLVPLLYNFRLEVVGLNQIMNTYAELWGKDAKYIKD